MLDYASKYIDGMDDDAEEEQAKTRRLPDAGRPPLRMMCTWWTHLKTVTAMIKKIQSRINLMRHSQSTDVSATALNHVVEKIAIPAPETTSLRMMPKTKKTPSSQPSNRTIGKIGKLALMNRP